MIGPQWTSCGQVPARRGNRAGAVANSRAPERRLPVCWHGDGRTEKWGQASTGRKATPATEVRPFLWLFFNAPNLGGKRIYNRNASQALNYSGLSRNYRNLWRKLWNKETRTHARTHAQRAGVLKADCCLQLSPARLHWFSTHTAHINLTRSCCWKQVTTFRGLYPQVITEDLAGCNFHVG